ncbi:NAD-dependent protein deacetylase [Spirochaetia bacterium]|nr:NAD-dependent protein deacetylase [Spirochaetia bacterium]
MPSAIEKFCRMLRAARHCATFTGAGVSTLSGIPDFRGDTGIFTNPPPGLFPELPPSISAETLFDLEHFEKDPTFFYNIAGPLVYTIHEKAPSIVHTTLAALEEQGLVKSVITQNIDLLHQKAGSRRVIELHGSPAFHYCLRCSSIRVGYDEAIAQLASGAYPRCPQCGRILKPAITFYGEPLPLDARRAAEEEAQSADLMLILGTSLQVRPAADIPRTTLRYGGKLVIVNRMPTPLDEYAELRFEDLEEFCEGAVAIKHRV